MGAEFGNYNANNGYGSTEYDVIRVIPGEPEAVRTRVAEALERLGYRVLDETPLRARRGTRGCASWGGSNDILAYPITINVGLKSAGPNATRATFDYSIKYPYLMSSDKAVIEREADALAALAARATTSTCGTCGAEIGTARFCRQCGAPATAAAPAELETLRLTRQANVGYKWHVFGLCLLGFALLLPLLLLLVDPESAKFVKVVRLITIFASSAGIGGLITMLLALRNFASLFKQAPSSLAAPALPRTTSGVNTNALPPHATSVNSVHSVTEATTDLLPEEKRTAANQSR